MWHGKRSVRLAVYVVGLLAGVLAGCGTSGSDAAQESRSSAPAVTPSALGQSPAPIANLRRLGTQRITGIAPKQIPHWQPGQDNQLYVDRTLSLLRDAAVKMQLQGSSRIVYTTYTSETTLRIMCDSSYEPPTPATSYPAARWCPDIGPYTLLVVPPAMEDPARFAEYSGYQLFHVFAKEFAAALAKSSEGPRLNCYIGLVYRGLALVLGQSINTMLPAAPNYQTLPGTQFALENGRCS